MTKFFVYLVLPLIAAFAITWEGLQWSGFLMTVPNDGTFFGGIVLGAAAILLPLTIVTMAFANYLSILFPNNHDKETES